jgi:hypothetical protein
LVFIDWCKRYDIEETILRLSSETKGGWGQNFLIDFTTTRMVVTKKKFLRKFVDLGYIAGMAPYPYSVLKGKVDPSYIRNRSSTIEPKTMLESSPANYYIWYPEINEFLIRKGVETTIRNMVGTMIQSNFMRVTTRNKSYEFTLPVTKNGTFEEINFWLGVVVPVKISTV